MAPEPPPPGAPSAEVRRAWGLGCGSLLILLLALTALAWLGPGPLRSSAFLVLLLAGIAGYFVVGLSLISRYLGLGGGLLSALDLHLRAWVARWARDPEALWVHWAGRVADTGQGLACLERAAALGSRGQLELGLARAERGMEELALPCFRRAAEQGSPQAMQRLVGALRFGPVLLRDEGEAARWEARLAGQPPVARRARSVMSGAGSDPAHSRRGPEDLLDLLWERPWMPWLCLAGLAAALPVVGLYLAAFTLLFVPLMWITLRLVNGPSHALRRRFRRRMEEADGGAPGAALALGRSYLEGGEGVPRDPLSACLWFRRSAEAGEVEGMVALAGMLASGHGCLPDPVEARTWFEAAAALGHAGASQWLREHPASGA